MLNLRHQIFLNSWVKVLRNVCVFCGAHLRNLSLVRLIIAWPGTDTQRRRRSATLDKLQRIHTQLEGSANDSIAY